MSDLESLEKRLDKVENRVDKLEDDIGDIKITNGRTEEKLNNIEKIVTKLNDITIPGLIEKIDNLNLKSHFDWMELIKNKGMPFFNSWRYRVFYFKNYRYCSIRMINNNISNFRGLNLTLFLILNNPEFQG